MKGLLSRDEQASFVRIFSSLLTAGRRVDEALYLIAEDYRDKGMFNFDVPFFPKLKKGYVAEILEEAAYDIGQGVPAKEVIGNLPLLDEDVRNSLARGLETEDFEKMSEALANVLEEEAKLRAKLNKAFVTPIAVVFVTFVLFYIICFQLVPKVESIVSHPEKLPGGIQVAMFVHHHPIVYFGYVFGVVGLIFLLRKTKPWEGVLPAYRFFDRLRFLSWLRILTDSGMRLYDAFLFLEDAGFTKKLKKKLQEAVDYLETGSTEDAVDVLKSALSSTDVFFIKAGLRTGDLSRELAPLLRMLRTETEKQIDKSVQVINWMGMIFGSLIIIAIYGGIIMPMTMGIKNAM